MILHVLRGLFVIILIAVAVLNMGPDGVFASGSDSPYAPYFGLAVCAGIALVVIALDLLVPTKSLAALSGLFLGIIVGLAIAFALGFVLEQVNNLYNHFIPDKVMTFVKVVLAAVTCYVTISFIMQTKDDFRFVIPYVEFSKQTKGARPMILDTSVIIDGRIADICETNFIDSKIIIPRFVLQELQSIADSSDKLKRNRGRRGLDILNRLQTNDKIDIVIQESRLPEIEQSEAVDLKLVALAKREGARIVTNDYNLNKIAQLRGVDVININDLANALKPDVIPGERLTVRIIKPGDQPGQGVGYLADGTMVVAENCRDKLDQEVTLVVTSSIQKSAGRMIFGRPADQPPTAPAPATRSRTHPEVHRS